MLSAVTRSTLTPVPSSISYRVTVGPRLKPVTAASTWNCFKTSVIERTTSSLAAERALAGVPAARVEAAGSRYGALGCGGRRRAASSSKSLVLARAESGQQVRGPDSASSRMPIGEAPDGARLARRSSATVLRPTSVTAGASTGESNAGSSSRWDLVRRHHGRSRRRTGPRSSRPPKETSVFFVSASWAGDSCAPNR